MSATQALREAQWRAVKAANEALAADLEALVTKLRKMTKAVALAA